MYYILLYDVVEDYINRRTPYRDAHLTVATAARRDERRPAEFP